MSTPVDASTPATVQNVVTLETVQKLIAAMDAERAAIEDRRSVRRNRNRLLVLCMGLTLSLLWPWLMMECVHTMVGTVWTTAISNTGDMGVTAYALIKHI